MCQIIAIIPARKGSKRIKGKNHKRLGKKPLIKYTIDEAKKSSLINKIVISTDDPIVQEIGEKEKITIIKRPKIYSTDNASSIDVIKHVIEQLEKKPEIIVLLQPTSPFRNAKDIDETIKLVKNKKGDSAETFTEIKERPEYMFTIDNNKNAKPLDKKNLKKSYKKLKKKYIENGAVYVIKTDFFIKNKSFYGKNHKGHIMPKERSLDIDEPMDWKLAELITNEK
jgi:CMP-N,N'-diacetyllegionaminic acid synthase